MSGPRLPIIERAYQIADSGAVASTRDLRRLLVKEGYPHSQVTGELTGLAIRRSLTTRIAKARS